MKSIVFAPLLVGLLLISAPSAVANTAMTNELVGTTDVCMKVSCEVEQLFIYDARQLKSGLTQELYSDVNNTSSQFKRSQDIDQNEPQSTAPSATFVEVDDEPTSFYMATIDIESKALLLTVNLIL
ncbi:MAG: hypothetical protein ACTMIA_03670 [Vibrio sp.]